MYEEKVWSFKTKRFEVALLIGPEESDPEDLFEFENDIQAVRSGSVAWFCARVVVTLDGREIGSDSLGGCAYKSVREFYAAHRDADPLNRNCSLMRAACGENICICHYFPDMVRLAVREARSNLLNAPNVRKVA